MIFARQFLKAGILVAHTFMPESTLATVCHIISYWEKYELPCHAHDTTGDVALEPGSLTISQWIPSEISHMNLWWSLDLWQNLSGISSVVEAPENDCQSVYLRISIPISETCHTYIWRIPDLQCILVKLSLVILAPGNPSFTKICSITRVT